MITTPYAAFGYVVFRQQYSPGEKLVVDCVTNADKLATIYYTDGEITYVEQTSGLTLIQTPGTFEAHDERSVGMFNVDTPEGCEFFCLDPKHNRGYCPAVLPFLLPANQEVELIVGTKLFFCRGPAEIKDQILTEPTQILVKNTPVTIKAKDSPVYGLLFL